jgi:hypothetical protein
MKESGFHCPLQFLDSALPGQHGIRDRRIALGGTASRSTAEMPCTA